MALGRDLLRGYTRALGDEPKLRAYLTGALIDDVGIAVSAWGTQILMTNLFVDQRERAKLMLPALGCFFAGCLVAGPLADWGARSFPEGLARRRWRLVVLARVIETLALMAAIWAVAGGTPTIKRLLPYTMISAFMKTALRPTRIAFQVDLLRRQDVQVDAHGDPLEDERGEPRLYKVHLLSFESMISVLKSVAVFGGLLLGGKILAAAGGRYTPLLVVDVITNCCFIAVVFFGCHPDRTMRGASLRDLRGDDHGAGVGILALLLRGARELGASLRDTVRFLAHRDQRALVWLLFGAWIVEVVTEFYDGKMLVKHVLHRSDDAVRWAEIGWLALEIAVVAMLPLLSRRVGSLGKIFLFTMLIDGIVIAIAGRLSIAGAAAHFLPFALLLGLDRGLTSTSTMMSSLAQNSASSAGMRGRIAATFALVVIISDIGAEIASTEISERIGLPSMLMWIGIVQVSLMILVALVGGKRLWSFGLRSDPLSRR